nr:hypothetical protein [Helicoverpa armigera nucleopolyhedrovirus]
MFYVLYIFFDVVAVEKHDFLLIYTAQVIEKIRVGHTQAKLTVCARTFGDSFQ